MSASSIEPTTPTKRALVLLGSAGGIGAGLVTACLESDPDREVWITYRSDRDAAEELRDQLGRGHVRQWDAGDAASAEALAADIESAGCQVEVVLHAVVDARSERLLGNTDMLSRALDVSATSLVRVLTAFQPLMAPTASVVYVTSIGATRAMPRYAHVGVAKAAAEAMVRYLAFELGRYGVRINAVGCGPIATKALDIVSGDAQALVDGWASRCALQPAPGLAELSSAVAFLSSPAASGVTGQVLTVDGGLWLR